MPHVGNEYTSQQKFTHSMIKKMYIPGHPIAIPPRAATTLRYDTQQAQAHHSKPHAQ
jgi:hypothetical protein